MNSRGRRQALLLEVGEHAALESLGFGEVGVRHIGGHVGIALAHVLQRQATVTLPRFFQPSRPSITSCTCRA